MSLSLRPTLEVDILLVSCRWDVPLLLLIALLFINSTWTRSSRSIHGQHDN